MKENFLHYLWKFKLFYADSLITTDGKKIEVVHPGFYNTNAGPDFLNAKVKIGDTLWAGNVEIHIKSSDFFAHKHQYDNAYNNLILHVVYENDIPSINNFFTVQVKNSFDEKLLLNFNNLVFSTQKLPCKGLLSQVPDLNFYTWLDSMFFERIEQKASQIKLSLSNNLNHLEEAFYFQLASNFGFKINQEPFELLARTLPLSILQKHKDNLFQLESLLFGTAGFLSTEFEDEYPRLLQNEYLFLKKKFSLQTLDVSHWKFLRMRPSNFPTIRIAQFAKLIASSTNLFSSLIECNNSKEVFKLMQVEANGYWLNHYRFDQISETKKKRIGVASIENIIINTIVPFLFYSGQNSSKESFLQKANSFMNMLKPENNNITRLFLQSQKKANNALESQAMIHLYKNYCSQKKCEFCSAGHFLLKNL